MMLKKQGTKRNVHNIKCWELIRQRMLCFNDQCPRKYSFHFIVEGERICKFENFNKTLI